MNKLLNKDDFFTGIILGIAITGITFLLLFGVYYIFQYFQIQMVREKSYLMLLSLIPPILVFRYYMVKLKYDKTGKGILVVAFLTMVLFFVWTHLMA